MANESQCFPCQSAAAEVVEKSDCAVDVVDVVVDADDDDGGGGVVVVAAKIAATFQLCDLFRARFSASLPSPLAAVARESCASLCCRAETCRRRASQQASRSL